MSHSDYRRQSEKQQRCFRNISNENAQFQAANELQHNHNKIGHLNTDALEDVGKHLEILETRVKAIYMF